MFDFLNKYDSQEYSNKVFEKKPSFNFKSCVDCAIVGNSGKILERKQGKEIDNHECIVRFNAAPTEEYEEYVGLQTDFRILNGPIMLGGSVDYVHTPGGWAGNLRDERLLLLPHKKKRKDHRFNQAKSLIHESNEILKTTDEFESEVKAQCSKQRIKKPSTGLKAIFIFLGCIGKVDLYGFGFHMENDLTKRHYWEEFKFDAPGGHNWRAEKRFVEKLDSSHYLNIK